MLWDLYEVRKYRLLDQAHFLELRAYLEAERFSVKKKSELTTTGYIFASRRGINVNWKDYIEYKWTLEDGSYRVSLKYYAKWRALASIAAGVLTAGLSAAVGAVTYTNAIREAEVFFENMWFRIERHVGQPEERIVLEKVGFGRYEPQWTEEERRLMNAHQPSSTGAAPPQPSTAPATTFSPTPSDFGYAPAGTTAASATPGASQFGTNPPGFVPAQSAALESQQEALVSGFGGEPSFTQPTLSDVKVVHKPGTMGETLLNPGNPSMIDPNLPSTS